MATDDPKDSLQSVIAFDPRDWSRYKRDAWIYGIVVGWDDALDEVADKHHWSAAERARLAELHRKFEALK